MANAMADARTAATVVFNRAYLTGRELEYLGEALAQRRLSGDGPFTEKCNKWLEDTTGCHRALLTHSCTAALEMAAILADVQPGDEVIMPSYTFVSTANAFALRGAVPVFVDIRADNLNLDETLIEQAITARTKAIVPVHYAGVGCAMDAILDIARRHDLLVIEDAAQGIGATYEDRPLGAIGDMGCLSFHETKNLVSGEGGALLLRDERLAERAEIIREKGTNRSQFFRGQVDKYTWVDVGSSYLPSELIAAVLWAQLEQANDINSARLAVWQQYHERFAALELAGKLRRPIIPQACGHNAHMYYLLLPSLQARTQAIERLKAEGVSAVFHYVPLHSAPAGRRFGRSHGALPITADLSDRLLRLPLWIGVAPEVERIAEIVTRALASGTS